MSRTDRATLEARWRSLTKQLLPAMAAAQRWPVRLDHCFMRICLDAALGAPWTATVDAPAFRNVSDARLARAVAVAKRCIAEPSILPDLNADSLAGRRRSRNEARR